LFWWQVLQVQCVPGQKPITTVTIVRAIYFGIISSFQRTGRAGDPQQVFEGRYRDSEALEPAPDICKVALTHNGFGIINGFGPGATARLRSLTEHVAPKRKPPRLPGRQWRGKK
jgi:hypothetical protein